jgi:hypothetical protein
MTDRRYGNAATTDLAQSIKVQTTDAVDVDRPGKTNYYQTSTWTTHNGYYMGHSSIRAVINKLKMWTVGKGSNVEKTKATTQKILDRVIGNGKETFDEVMKNQVGVRHIDGNSYAEIVGGKGTKLLNLKPLNPGAVKVYYNEFGMLDHYGYQYSDSGEEQRFEKEEIFHLSLNRNADGMGGTGDIECLIKYLDKIKQLDEDMAVMFHRYIVPMIIWKLNTTDETDIGQFKATHKIAKDSGNDIIISDKATDWDLVEAGKNGVDPLSWRQTWVEEVTKGGGVPALIMAIEAGSTEASSKMVYVAWQQVIEDEQNYLEKQIKLQLGLDVTFEFPARIEENLGEDEGKDGKINTGKKSEVSITSTKAPTPSVKKE